ncbi:polyketide cyclase/dehydrase/lipid transport protein [Kribbella steppae]|uniref:Polyketide cyclase/dehydrase/lipid transport protein n=1 Tax=Kribbella steppae TaxID=2512223 RepID=A0A4R2H372_9ACTN|nr:SRPBCC family protein [Kribbella steppae]TCO18004.1 polyketide cyclase/dehydrase/lipid transport protein [Kribbella steppae]
MKIEASVIIQRRPEDVFAFLEVRSNDAAWMASVVESEWLDSTAADVAAPIGVGRRGRMVLKLPGRQAEFIDEVTEYEPGERIAHRTVKGPIPLNTACICEPAGGSCLTTVVGATDCLPAGLLGRFAAPVVAKVIRRGFEADLDRLKKILEADGPATNGP